jgi:1-phosphofructokinase
VQEDQGGHAPESTPHSAYDPAVALSTPSPPRVAIFGPNPLLSITIEDRGSEGDDVHLHAAGQGVWVARMAGELAAEPVLCGLIGGETGRVLRPLLERLPGERRLVETRGSSGCYVLDRRSGERRLISEVHPPPPSRHELDELVSATCAVALECQALVVCNPFPGDTLPLDVYGSLVQDVSANGIPVLVDLSSPRLESALEGRPDLVKLNDWELAEFVSGPVADAAQLRRAAERVRDSGAGLVVVTRGGDPALVVRGDEAWTLTPPRFDRGFREGCGDSMMGGLAASIASGADWRRALVTGAAAGAANFLRHGLGSGSDRVVEDLVPRVTLSPADQ